MASDGINEGKKEHRTHIGQFPGLCVHVKFLESETRLGYNISIKQYTYGRASNFSSNSQRRMGGFVCRTGAPTEVSSHLSSF